MRISNGCNGCGYPNFPDGPDKAMAYTAQWQRDHRAAHLAAFPDLDAASRVNLDDFVRAAEERESGAQDDRPTWQRAAEAVAS